MLMVFQVFQGLGYLVIEAANKALRLGGLPLKGTQSVEVWVSRETNFRHALLILRRRFQLRSTNISFAHTNVACRRGHSLSVHIRGVDSISLIHSRRVRGSRRRLLA